MDPRARKAFRAVLAGSLALVLAGVATPPAYADAGVTEVATYQPDAMPESAQDVVLMAGATGFAHRRQGYDDPQWTDYATGASHDLPWLAGVADTAVHPGGGDTIAVVGTDSLTVHTPDGDTVSTYPIPSGFTLRGVAVDGTRAVVTRPAAGATPAEISLLDLTGGGVTVPITGLPAGATVLPWGVAVDGASHAAVGFRLPDAPPWYALLDMSTGATTPVPQVPLGVTKLYLTGADFAWGGTIPGAYEVGMLPEAAILDGTADTLTPQSVTLDRATYPLAPVGGHLLVGVPSTSQPSMLDFPFADGIGKTALRFAPGMPVLASDGGALAVGGADTTSSAVRRYAPAADAGLTTDTVLDLPPVTPTNAGISLAHGNLRHIESFRQLSGPARLKMFNHDVAPDTDPDRIPYGRLPGGTLPSGTIRCESGQECVRTVDGNWYGTSMLVTDSTGATQIWSQIDGYTSTTAFTLPTTGGRIVDASLNYQLVAGGSTGQQYVVETGQVRMVSSGPITGAALWDDTLWQAPTTAIAGTVTATDLGADTPTVVRTITTGTACRPTELQVSQHWLYWSCGESGPAGVVDLTTGRRTSIEAGRVLLGDGFLVRHDPDAGRLLLTDLHDGAVSTPQVLADLPASSVADDRGITWAVDRFGGDVAYVDGHNVTHVLDPGLPASAPTGHVEQDSHFVEPRNPGGYFPNWYASFALARPVQSWRLDIVRAANGQTVHTEAGGPTRQAVAVDWDGRRTDGSPALSGNYRWQLTVTADGVTRPVGGASGTVAVHCGTRPFRTYSCYGEPAVLTVRTDGTHYGEATWWEGTSSGKLTAQATETWRLGSGSTQVSALVPFGDINDDGHGDLLARTGDGVMYAYLGTGQGGFGSAKKVRLGGGYNAYNALLSVGDVDGDGYDDLVERDTSGTVWFKGGTGKTALKARVRIATGWNAYTRLAAIGDVNGDGRGDLLAVDRNNVVWRYYGTAGGTFPHRTKIATGWNSYNRIIGVGDLNGDGRNDLITRDSAGVIWRYDGTADATFPHRVQIATGWNRYAGVY